MNPLTIKNLSANAFRILGLTAGASQAEIDAAARKMRIWDDPAMIPATANDAKWLGPVPRSKQDIENAVARLADPVSRVEERLWWFCGKPPDSPTTIAKSSAAPALHDLAMLNLYRCLLTNAASENIEAWRKLIERFKHLTDSDDYLQWLFESESAGDFEKRASPDEIATAQKQMALRLSTAVVGSIDDALASEDFVAAAQVVSLVRAGTAGSAVKKDPAETMLDRMEDDLVGLCNELREKIDAAWETRQIAKMRPACNHVMQRYQSAVGPLIEQMIWTTEDIDRKNRAKMHGVKLLVHTSAAYEAIYDFIASERTLTTASNLAHRTPMEPMVDNLLEKVKPAARRQRAGAPMQNRQQPDGKGKFKVINGSYNKTGGESGFPTRLIWIFLMLVSGIARVGCNSNSYSPSSNVPRYHYPSLDR